MTRDRKPKYLVKISRRGPQNTERATYEGEWPFENNGWTIIYHPYSHNSEDETIWLEPDIEHTHILMEQNIKMRTLLPEYNPKTCQYDITEELPYCLLCGVFMQKETWQYFKDCKEVVKLSVKR